MVEGPFGLVCMEIFGLHEWVKDITRRVGHLGAFAVAPDYYFRAETNGVDLTKIDDMQKLFPIVNAKTDTEPFAIYRLKTNMMANWPSGALIWRKRACLLLAQSGHSATEI